MFLQGGGYELVNGGGCKGSKSIESVGWDSVEIICTQLISDREFEY